MPSFFIEEWKLEIAQRTLLILKGRRQIHARVGCSKDSESSPQVQNVCSSNALIATSFDSQILETKPY